MTGVQRAIRPAVLLDRDGTIIVDRHYLRDPREVELLPGTVEGLRLLTRLGYLLVIVTNQSGIARGLLTRADVDATNDALMRMLAGEGARIEQAYVCPHHPGEGCACRKPGTALAEKAAAELGFDAGAAYVIGDRDSDLEMGRRLGATTIRVGKPWTCGSRIAGVTRVAPNLLEAARIVVADAGAMEAGRSA